MDSYFTTVVAAAFGWLLSELSHRIRANAERRAALGRALSELLEIHHYLKGVDVIFSAIRERFQLSPNDVLEGLKCVDRILPPDPHLPERYNAAVSQIAEINPVLAYRLRSKDQLPLFLIRLRALQLQDNPPPPIRLYLDDFLRSTGLETIEEAIIEVARAHSILTWHRTRKLMRRKLKLPKEYYALMEQFERTTKQTQSNSPESH